MFTTDQKRAQTQDTNGEHTIAEWIEILLDALNGRGNYEQDITYENRRLDIAGEAIEENITLNDGEEWAEGRITPNIDRLIKAMERVLNREYGDGWELHVWGTPSGGVSVSINHELSRTDGKHAAKNKPAGRDVEKWFGCVLVNNPSRVPRNYDPELSSGPYARKAVETFSCYQEGREWYDQYDANVALVPYSKDSKEKRGFLAMKTKRRTAGGYAR